MTTLHDELRTAAAKLRTLATAVSAPDQRDQTFHADGTEITQGRAPWMYDVATAQTPELADFIAAMGPTVGMAVADWLTHAADTLHTGRIHGTDLVICDPCCEQLPCHHIKPALAVARAINGTTEPTNT